MKDRHFGELIYYRGRVGLFAILKELGIGPGDAVALQAFTCQAVPESILAAKARPLYIDIEDYGYTMSPDSLRQRIAANTRAIVVQHTFGIPCRMEPILELAAARGIPVIEDCCHALAGSYNGTPLGAFGLASFYSFEWGKPLAAGIGGAVATKDPDFHRRLTRSMAHFARPDLLRLAKIEMQYLGFHVLYRPTLYWAIRSVFHKLAALKIVEGNFLAEADTVSPEYGLRMSPFVLRRVEATLGQLPKITAVSERLTAWYREHIQSPRVAHPQLAPGSRAVLCRYPLRVRDKAQILQRAEQQRLEVSGWYTTPIHPLPEAQLTKFQYALGMCINAEKRCQEIISLPLNRTVREAYLHAVAKLLNAG